MIRPSTYLNRTCLIVFTCLVVAATAGAVIIDRWHKMRPEVDEYEACIEAKRRAYDCLLILRPEKKR